MRVPLTMPITTLLPIVFLGALLSAFGGILLKMGAVLLPPIQDANDLLVIARNWRIIAGLAMYFIPAVMWIILLRKVELSLLQPLMSIVYVITPILSIFLLHETVSVQRWAGVAIIILGVAIISGS